MGDERGEFRANIESMFYNFQHSIPRGANEPVATFDAIFGGQPAEERAQLSETENEDFWWGRRHWQRRNLTDRRTQAGAAAAVLDRVAL